MLIRHIYGFAVFGQNKPSVLGGQQQSFGQWSDERIVLRLHENLVHEQRVVRSDIRFSSTALSLRTYCMPSIRTDEQENIWLIFRATQSGTPNALIPPPIVSARVS